MEHLLTKDKIWMNARNILRIHLNDDSIYNHWFSSIKAISFQDDFVLGVSDEFFADWLEDHYSEEIKHALREASGNEKIAFRFEVGHTPVEDFSTTPVEDKNSTSYSSEVIHIVNCNPKFTLDKFVVGDGNDFSYSAAAAIGQAPGISFNPWFIYGGTGLGKTHLIQASAHEAIKNNKKLKVEYYTCEEFCNAYTDALQNNKISEFRKKFRKIDMLLIDDVQFLTGKEKLQEEFFNTFNALYNDNKQIVLTSDRSPREINGLEARLVSRFETGLTTDIQPPGLEMRVAILKKKQEEQIVKLSDEILYFIASKITSNVRRLEGALIRLTALTSMTGAKIDLGVAERILHPIIIQEAAAKVTIEMVQKKVAEHFDLMLKDLVSDKRPKNIAYPRMIAMYLSRELTEYSLPVIGESFGGRTHATVINAINKIRKERLQDKSMDHSISF
ncbi:MAG: chromosomal replication initiator protein DnaA, partial [Lentisphaerota bacterium]